MSPGLDNKGKSVRKNDRLISNELKLRFLKRCVNKLSAAIRSSDSSSLVRYQKTAGSKSTTNNDALLTSKWLERKKLDELGIKYKKGIYTMEEDEVLYAALNKYKILIYGTTPAEHKGFWREIATPLGTRPLKNVCIHVQRLFHHHNYTGKWSPEDDKRLNHSNSW
ncbi:19713_t:CDS:2 [Entrophospora sp. SA101]|nr:19713_t:CDS:2 [Entrophospora sp. SA101]